ncbi:MAG TPA: hypothetical protein VEQ17_03395 [Steroidobacteraceae bacterium]|nr:hypothetical protein [Steroidobacteraceae bacterium]
MTIRVRCLGLIVAMALSACGGGEDTAAPPSGNNPPATPPVTPPATQGTTVTFASKALALTANTSAAELTDESIALTLTNPPTAAATTRVTVTAGVAIVAGEVHWPTQSGGKLFLLAQPPGSLGAGTYTSTVKVEVCTDAQCTTQVSGSPANIAVTYVVTGSAMPTTQVYWSPTPPTGAELQTAETRSPTMNLQIATINLPPGGIYLRHTDPTGTVIKSMVLGEAAFIPQVGVAFGQYNITLQPPAALGSGLFPESVSLQACFDAACTQVVPGSAYSMAFNLLIPATEGVEFTRRLAAPERGATNLVWSQANQSLYVASSQLAAQGIDPQVSRIDPLTAAIGPTATLAGENLRPLAVSTDGSYLYAGSKTQALVHRLQLPAMTPDLSIPLGSFNGTEPYVVSDFAMLAGQPQSFVAALSHNNSSGGIVVFDNATARATSIAPVQALELPRWLVPTPVPGTFLSQSYGPSAPQVNTLDQVEVSASGISTASSATMAAGLILGGKPQRTGNRLYSPDGKALNATTGALLAVLGLPEQGVLNGLLVDEANNRMFIWAVVRARPFILSYDLTTLKLLAFAPLPLPVGSTTASTPGTGNMTLWGADGLAVADGTQVIILSGAFFSSYRGEPTIPRL